VSAFGRVLRELDASGRERAVSIRLEDLDVPVASIQDLIAMKTLAGRPKDFEDIAALQAIEKSRGR